MVSKELLSEVLGRECTSFVIRSNIITYNCKVFGIQGYKFSKVVETINMYELAHECKEWATLIHSQYFLVIFVDGISETTHIRQYGVDIVDRDLCNIMGFTAETEPEAIFKACQWILDNKEI